MPFCPVQVIVEYEGAMFAFVKNDEAQAGLDKAFVERDGGAIALALRDYFDKSVVSWEGVVDADGNALPCNPETKAAWIVAFKSAVVDAYMDKLKELVMGKVEPPEPPSPGSSPETTADGRSLTTAPASDTPAPTPEAGEASPTA